jgi:hypothetical protein
MPARSVVRKLGRRKNFDPGGRYLMGCRAFNDCHLMIILMGTRDHEGFLASH